MTIKVLDVLYIKTTDWHEFLSKKCADKTTINNDERLITFCTIILLSITDPLTLKLADPALSSDLYPGDYVPGANDDVIPLRWAAPEVICGDEDTVESDVVSGIIYYIITVVYVSCSNY